MNYFLLSLLLLSQNKTDTNYYNNPNIKETRQKIAIIDTGIDLKKAKDYLCNGKHYDFTNTGINDDIGHGTNIAGIIAKKLNINKQCLLIIKYYSSSINGRDLLSNSLKAFEAAQKEHAKFINYSSGGFGWSRKEKYLVQRILNNKTYLIFAAGNNQTRLSKEYCDYFPPCYNFKSRYFHVVGNGKSSKEVQQRSNYGEIVTDWRDGKNIEGFGIVMSGTSQSTALLTSELINK